MNQLDYLPVLLRVEETVSAILRHKSGNYLGFRILPSLRKVRCLTAVGFFQYPLGPYCTLISLCSDWCSLKQRVATSGTLAERNGLQPSHRGCDGERRLSTSGWLGDRTRELQSHIPLTLTLSLQGRGNLRYPDLDGVADLRLYQRIRPPLVAEEL